jgi:hypothetical protein
MDCDSEPCLGAVWLAANDWGPCSSACIANASDTASLGHRLGVSTASAPRCVRVVNGSTQEVEETLCGPQTVVRGMAVEPSTRQWASMPVQLEVCFHQCPK